MLEAPSCCSGLWLSMHGQEARALRPLTMPRSSLDLQISPCPFRQFDGESNKRRKRRGNLKGHGDICRSSEDRGIVKGRSALASCPCIESHKPEQHDGASSIGEDQELQRSVFSPRSSPDPDKEEHRNQYYFPEDIEQNQIQRSEHSDYSRLEDQKER